MRFKIPTGRLKEAIDTVSRVTGANPLTPILENIYIEASTEHVRLMATNMDITLDTYIKNEGEVLEIGVYTLSSKLFGSYISLLSDSEVEVILHPTSGMIELKSQSGETKLKGLSAEKFPLSQDQVERDRAFEISAKDLKMALEKTLFSTAKENVRPSLAGVFVGFHSDYIAFASTDSYRLTEYRVSIGISDVSLIGKNIIIPERSANEILKLLRDENITVRFELSDGSIKGIIGSTNITSRLITGKFPDYSNFFPKTFSTKVVSNRQEFISGLKRIQLIARENKDNVRVTLSHELGLEITTGETQIGTGRSIVKGSLEGNEERIGLNCSFLLEVLQVIREDFVSLDFETPLSPILVHGIPSTTKEAQAFRHIIMPLKI